MKASRSLPLVTEVASVGVVCLLWVESPRVEGVCVFLSLGLWVSVSQAVFVFGSGCAGCGVVRPADVATQ